MLDLVCFAPLYRKSGLLGIWGIQCHFNSFFCLPQQNNGRKENIKIFITRCCNVYLEYQGIQFTKWQPLFRKLNRTFYFDCAEGGIVPRMHCAVCNQQWPQSCLPIFASAKQTEFPHETEWKGRLHRRYRVLHSLHPLTVTSAIRSRRVDNRFIPFYSVFDRDWWTLNSYCYECFDLP